MELTPDQFLSWPQRAVTLLGMSGVGKTFLSNRLPKTGWFHYSGDYRIGTKYLAEPILDNIKRQAMKVDFLRELLRSDSIYIASNITVDNLDSVSTFLGKLGNRSYGGLPLDEFRRRQELHRQAEARAMIDVAEFIGKSREIYGYDHFLNDAGGSICELANPKPLEVLVENTVILYLRADHEMEEELIRRAVTDPKPLYFEPKFLNCKLAQFLRLENLEDPSQMHPDKFARWVFPKLLAHRRPLYRSIADRYGYTVDARAMERVNSEEDFLELVAGAIAAKD